MNRSIIHLGIDSFFAAVEVVDHPGCRFKPVVVSTPAKSGPEVCSVSSEAARRKIREHMSIAEARELCPETVVLPARFKRYKEISDKVRGLCLEYTPVVESLGLDENFLELKREQSSVTRTTQIAGDLKRRVKTELRLATHAGVGPNKFLARLASGQVKPSGFKAVDRNRVQEFLAHVPIQSVFSLGSVAGTALAELGVHTMGDLAHASRKDLVQKFGKAAAAVARMAEGMDDNPVLPYREPKSLSREITLRDQPSERAPLERAVRDLAKALEENLWKRDLMCLTVTLKVKHPNSNPIRKSTTLLSPVQEAEPIRVAALNLLRAHQTAGRPVECIGIIVTNLIPEGAPYQLSLF